MRQDLFIQPEPFEFETGYPDAEFEAAGDHDFKPSGALVSDVPAPGRYYRIQYGKGGLLTTAGRAYGLREGPERLKRAQDINNHPLNRKFWGPPANAFDRKFFKEGIISFNPRFTCGDRKCFATIWIPPAKPYSHPFLGQGVAVDSFDEPVDPRQSETELDEESSLEGFSAGRRIDTTKVPFRWICRLRVFVRQPDGAVKEFFTSGTLVGPSDVLTAAHVFDANWENDVTTPIEVLAINVAPGADGLRLPFSWSKTKPGDWKSHPNWRSGNWFDGRFDVGMIKLKKPIAYRKFRKLKDRALGFWGNASHDDGVFFQPFELLPDLGIKTLIDKKLNICGYRTDGKGRPTLLPATIRSVGPTASGHRIREVRIREVITYDTQTSLGMSGSPAWYWDERAERRHLIAVHHGGCDHRACPNSQSPTKVYLDDCTAQMVGEDCITTHPKVGVLLRQPVFRQIRDWIYPIPPYTRN